MGEEGRYLRVRFIIERKRYRTSMHSKENIRSIEQYNKPLTKDHGLNNLTYDQHLELEERLKNSLEEYD